MIPRHFMVNILIFKSQTVFKSKKQFRFTMSQIWQNGSASVFILLPISVWCFRQIRQALMSKIHPVDQLINLNSSLKCLSFIKGEFNRKIRLYHLSFIFIELWWTFSFYFLLCWSYIAKSLSVHQNNSTWPLAHGVNDAF